MSQFFHLPYFSIFFFLYVGFTFTVVCTRRFSWNSHVCTQVYWEQSCMLWFFTFLERLSVAGWVWMIAESSLMLLKFVYPLCFWLETLFDLIFENVLVISFSIFCFGISALGLFYLGSLFDGCLLVIAESKGCRVILLIFYLI